LSCKRGPPQGGLGGARERIKGIDKGVRGEEAFSPSMKELKFFYVGGRDALEAVYPKALRERAAKAGAPLGEPLEGEEAAGRADLLAEADAILATWGMARLDASFLEKAPRLRAVLYAAGSIRKFATPESWDRGVAISSAYAVNAIAVSEYALGSILLALKRVLPHARRLKRTRDWRRSRLEETMAGGYRSQVGLISLGAVGRLVAERLKPFDVEVVAYDPVVDPSAAEACGARLASLEELFETSDVASLHAPLIEATRGMIGGDLLRSMKRGATFLNTARGAVVRQDELIETARLRPDLEFQLDVVFPEPPQPDSELFELDNVTLTPHIAGSLGRERERMGLMMVEELERLARGEPLRHAVTREQAAVMA